MNEYYFQILQYLIAFHNLPAWSLDLTTCLLAVKIGVKGVHLLVSDQVDSTSRFAKIAH